MDVILIAAVTANGMIARHRDEVVAWSRDLQLFRKQTMGQTVIMGSRTARTLATDLEGRKTVVVHRDTDPAEVLAGVETEQCFVIGGSRTFSRFAPYLTHLYLTYHPLVFPSRALVLFDDLEEELRLEFLGMVEVKGDRGIYQFQYRVVGR